MEPDFRLFRHVVTGKTDYFPEHYQNYPHFEEVDPSEVPCVDCVVSTPEPQEDAVVFLPYTEVEIDLEEDEEMYLG